MEQDMKNIFKSLDSVLSNTDIADVTSETGSFQELPDGYYLSEVKKAELKESKSSHQPMVAFEFSIVEDGRGVDSDGNYIDLKKTKNRRIFLYYVLKDEASVRRFVADMLKFEGDKAGEPILGKEYFTNSELLIDALEILEGMRIYIQSSTTTNDDNTTSNWKNLISWKRAKALELE